jgi:hypothetical protein
VRSKLDLGFIVSLPLSSSSASQDISVEGVFSASADAEAVEATCSKCGCPTADSRRSYVAIGANVIIQLKRFRWDAAANANSKVRKESCPCPVFMILNNARNAQDSSVVALSPVLSICTSPAPAPPPFSRNLLEVASTSRFLSYEGSDDDMPMVVVTNDASSHPPPDSNVLQLQRDGSSIRRRFDLVGNVMHTGQTLNSGHYYADVRCNGSWIRVNDTSVQHIEWDHCRLQSPSWSHMAYVQIYSCSSNHLQAAQVLEPRK